MTLFQELASKDFLTASLFANFLELPTLLLVFRVNPVTGSR
jgi:hypothetical protein